jgi:hypothetical protein
MYKGSANACENGVFEYFDRTGEDDIIIMSEGSVTVVLHIEYYQRL